MGIKSLAFLLGSSLLAACLAIDTTPLERDKGYHQTKAAIQKMSASRNVGPQAAFLAGAARVEITPPSGTPLAGYSNRHGIGSLGVHDPIYTRALVIVGGGQTVILIANDLLAITNEIYEAVYQDLSGDLPIDKEGLMISASHTHSGPGAMGKKRMETLATGPYDPKIFKQITRQMARAARMAYQNIAPAQMGFARETVPALIRNRMVKEGPTDPTLDLVTFKTDHQMIYLVNFSAHPTILNAKNFLVSGDFPGVLEAHLEREADVVALYTAGSVADMGPHPPVEGDPFHKIEAMGDALAQAVLLAAPREETYQQKMILGSRLVKVQLTPVQMKIGQKKRLASSLGRMLLDSETTVQAIRLGPVMLLGIPGDLSAAIGLEIKAYAAAMGINAIIIGFANDYIGYIIPSEYYTSGVYESFMSFNGPHMDRYIKEIGMALIDALA